MHRFLLLTVLLAMTALLAIFEAGPAAAFERPFPPQTKRGILNSVGYLDIVLNGKPRVLAPGAQIRNPENQIELPTGLRVRNSVVNYTEDVNGEIMRIWMLTPEEIARTRPSPTPVPLPTPRPIPTGPPSPDAGNP